MRKAYTDVGWLLGSTEGLSEGAQPSLMGFSLGFDFCAQHEWGLPFIKESLGLPRDDNPVGVEGRTISRTDNLHFLSYEHRSADKRVKRTMPAALLYCSKVPEYSMESKGAGPEKLAHMMGASFQADFSKDKRWYNPERDDIVSSWSSQSGFAIHVRGQENVERLKELHEAFLAHKIAVGGAATMGFMRNAVSFILVERLPQAIWDSVRATDEAHLRLLKAAKATGIEERLKAANLGWYALSPRWSGNQEGSELLFFLNPKDQRKYASGWFNLKELEQWIDGVGPVVDSNEIEPLLKKQYPDLGIFLITAAQQEGLGLARAGNYVWLDKPAGKMGVVIDFVNDQAFAGLKPVRDNVYAWEDLEPHIVRGQALYQQERAERERAKASAEAA